MKKKKLKKKIKEFFNTTQPIIIFLILIIIVLLIYCNYLLRSTKVYMFNGSNNYVNIYNGIISLNYDVNVIEGSDIKYVNDKDIIVTDYKIGYYVKDKDTLLSLAVISDNDPEGLSLKAVLEGISSFNLTELNSNKKFFSKKAKKSIKDGLYFVIEATDKDGNTIMELTNLNLTKLTK